MDVNKGVNGRIGSVTRAAVALRYRLEGKDAMQRENLCTQQLLEDDAYTTRAKTLLLCHLPHCPW